MIPRRKRSRQRWNPTTGNVQAPLPDSGVISTTGNTTSRQIQPALTVIF